MWSNSKYESWTGLSWIIISAWRLEAILGKGDTDTKCISRTVTEGGIGSIRISYWRKCRLTTGKKNEGILPCSCVPKRWALATYSEPEHISLSWNRSWGHLVVGPLARKLTEKFAQRENSLLIVLELIHTWLNKPRNLSALQRSGR